MKNFYTFLLLILIIGTAFSKAGAQTHFVATGDPTSAMNITITEARFNGVDLEAGDEIGIFDGNVCVGAFVLVKSLGPYNDANIAAARAFGNDPLEPGKGFVAGRTIKYRFWDKSEMFECIADSIVATCYNPQAGGVVVNCPAFAVGESAFVGLVGKSFIDHTPVSTGDVFSTNEDTPLSASVATNDASMDLPNTWTALTTPGHGTFAFNADGSFLYTPEANYNGTVNFTYSLCDGDGDCATAAVTITIVAVNDLPVAVADNFTTNEDTPITGDLNLNDTPSGDGGNVWSIAATSPAHGIVTVGPTGAFTYTPAANYYGSDSFTYQLCDADGDCVTALVSLTVVSVSDLPVAVADNVTVNEDEVLAGNLAANDTPSPDGGNVWSKKTDPAHGSVVVQTDGAFTYTPVANYNGADSFVYQLCDVDGECVTAVVTITVTPVDDFPVAVADNATTNEDVPVTGDLAANDTPSPDGGNVWSKSTDPAHGTVVVQVSGSFTYTPAANYNGADHFVYQLCDGDGDCVTATVSLVVNPVNDLPLATNDVVTVLINVATTGDVALNDVLSGDGGNVFGLKTAPQHGIVTLLTDGKFTYTPETDYTGPDSFTYQLCDVDNDCVEATVNISVFFNTFPTANADEFTTLEDTPLSGNVATNDYPSGDGGNVWAKVTDPLHGAVAVNANGSFTYTPAANYNGPDSFVYKVSDVDGETSTALVTITITPVDDQPSAVADSYTVNEDVLLTGNLKANDVLSGDGGNVWSKTANPSHGTVTVNPDGTFSYMPEANFFGSDSFTYSICDADGDCSVALVTLTVEPVDDLPVAVADNVTVTEDIPHSGTVASNDVLSGDGGNTWTIKSGALHGTVSMNSNGNFTYSPVANYYGSDSFMYSLCDLDGDCSDALVSITVTSVDEFPLAEDDMMSVNEDAVLTGSLAGNDTPSNDGGNVWSKATNPAHGTVTVSANGDFTYTPAANYHGPDSFTYQLCDVDGDCDAAVVQITVIPVDDQPVANDDETFIKTGMLLSGNLGANDVNNDGGSIWSLVTPPAHGTAVVNANGTYTYVSEVDYIGLDHFVYRLCDADEDCVTATVTIDVYNAPPDLQLVDIYCVYLSQYGKWTLSSFNKKEITAGSSAHFGTYDDLKFTFSRVSFGCNDVEAPVKVEVTAADERGSTTTDFFYLYVLDTIRPFALCKSADIYLDSWDQAFLVPGKIDAGSFDNCGIEEIHLSKQLFTKANVGVNQVKLTVIDKAGNTDECVATVTVYPKATVVEEVKVVNAAPAIADITDATIGTSPLSLEIPLMNISAGETDGSQKVTMVTAVADNPSLFTSVQVVYNEGESAGKLLLTAAEGMTGVAIITIQVKDNGGTSNGGVDTTVKSFKVTVNTVNNEVVNTPEETIVEVVTPAIVFSDESALKLWPNPTRGEVSINLTGTKNNPVMVKVYNLQGVRVFVKEYQSGELITFDISKHVTGMYIVDINISGISVNRKIVLTK